MRVEIAVASASADTVDKDGHALAAAVDQSGVEAASVAHAVVFLYTNLAQLCLHGRKLVKMGLQRTGTGLLLPRAAHEIRPYGIDSHTEHAEQRKQHQTKQNNEQYFHWLISSCWARRKWGIPTCRRTKPATNRSISDRRPKQALPQSANTSE